MTPKPALTNAVKMMKESYVDAVKLQGGQKMFDIIKAVADASVPVIESYGPADALYATLWGLQDAKANSKRRANNYRQRARSREPAL